LCDFQELNVPVFATAANDKKSPAKANENLFTTGKAIGGEAVIG
jgi:hypothetical protein